MRPMHPKLRRILRLYTFPERMTVEKERTVFRGTAYHMSDAEDFEPELPETFLEMLPWRDGRFRRVWFDADHHFVVTFCEGDITVERYRSTHAFLSGMRRAEQFYQAA